MIILFTSLAFFNFSYTPAHAFIIINEVYPRPNTAIPNDTEWIELVNTDYSDNSSFMPPALTGWTIWDTTSTPSLLFTFTSETIFSEQFFIIEISSKLNNYGDGVIIKNNLGQIVNEMSYSSSQEGMSWSKTIDSPVTYSLTTPTKNSNNLLFDPTPKAQLTATPTLPIPTTPPTLTPSLPVYQTTQSPTLSEIMACPIENSEWIEFYNPHQTAINLENWTIYDFQGKIFEFSITDSSISHTIPPTSYFIIEINQKLNNGGDTVTLKNPTQETTAQMTYETCTKGSSWIWYENNWLETLNPTKNSSNIFTEPITPTPSIGLSPTPQPTITTAQNSLQKLPTKSPSRQITNKTKSQQLSYNSSQIYLNELNIVGDNNSSLATFLTSPPFSDHLIFNTTITQKNRLISVIMGGMILVATGSYTIYDYTKYDINKA